MFTGIIEEKGTVLSNKANRLILSAPFPDLIEGESIAVNGVCLTLVSKTHEEMAFDLSIETLAITNLSDLKANDTVNLERAMQASTRFGGHYVSGHVDTTAQVRNIIQHSNFLEVTIDIFGIDARLFLLPKGSITLDGVSLTINSVEKNSIGIMLVPHTLEKTNLAQLQIDKRINVEFDYLTRIIAHQVQLMGQLQNEVEIR